MAKAAQSTRRGSEKGLSDLFEHGLRDIFYAEKKIYRSLPKMIKAAQDPALKDALTQHREETQEQISRLEEVFEMIGKRARGEKCDAMDGILEEAEGILEDFGDTPAGDAAIIFSAQAVEHYEITRYGSMQAYAEALGMKDAARLIGEILQQEKNADIKLSKIAEQRVNHAAEQGDTEDAGDEEMAEEMPGSARKGGSTSRRAATSR